MNENPINHYEVEARGSITIEVAAYNAAHVSGLFPSPIWFSFDGVKILVGRHDSPSQICAKWQEAKQSE